MVGGMIGVIWSSYYAAMNRIAVRGTTEEERAVRHLRDSLEFCPAGNVVEFITD
jgi:hypothetical protein